MATSQDEARESRHREGHHQSRIQAFKSDKPGASEAIILVVSYNIGTSDPHSRGNTGHRVGCKTHTMPKEAYRWHASDVSLHMDTLDSWITDSLSGKKNPHRWEGTSTRVPRVVFVK